MPRPEGTITRGTTNPNRLRRLDRWIGPRTDALLNGTPAPLVVDLGYGATTVTTRQWYRQLRANHPNVKVVGLEIDPLRVREAAAKQIPGRLEFRLGGFELAGLRPQLVRAMNVLRQYDESEVDRCWLRVCRQLAPGGRFVEGTCDELGRIASWVLLDADGPRTLTLSANLPHLDSPTVLAERLPKALIHRNVPGEPVHRLLTALEESWRDAAAFQVFGPRDRWRRSLNRLRALGWQVEETPPHRRDGTLTVPWHQVAPNR